MFSFDNGTSTTTMCGIGTRICGSINSLRILELEVKECYFDQSESKGDVFSIVEP